MSVLRTALLMLGEAVAFVLAMGALYLVVVGLGLWFGLVDERALFLP